MVRVLHVVSFLGSGGVEAFLYNYYKNMDRKKIKFDFIVHGNGGVFEEKFLELGSTVYHVTPRRKHPLKYVLEVKKIIEDNHYDVVHAHIERWAFIPLFFAKKKSIKTRVSHAHLSNQPKVNFTKRLFIPILQGTSKRYATHFFACSHDAAVELFGESLALRSSKVIKNAIDMEKFSYSTKKRDSLRRELGVVNNFVVGHIGRFVDQKNHTFLIEIFHELRKVKKNSKLVLVGEGPLEKSVTRKLNEYGLVEDTLFLGVRDDVNDLMSAFDVFVFPSNFEGLGIVLIEAQACSLPCITSDEVVPREADVSKYIQYLSLSQSPKNWASTIEELVEGCVRSTEVESVRECGYDIKIEAKKLQSFYFERSGKNVVNSE